MDPEFVGRRVSLDCGGLGFYQGTIAAVHIHDQTLTIREPFKNGKACGRPQLTFSVQDITDLQFLKPLPGANETNPSGQDMKGPKSSTVQVVKKKAPKMADKIGKKNTHNARFSPAIAQSINNNSSNPHHQLFRTGSPRKGDGFRGNTPNRRPRDEDCFGSLNEEDILSKEFDFEENLALFDKKMVFEEIEDEISKQNQPDVIRLVDYNKKRPQQSGANRSEFEPKYRNDENVLIGLPTQTRPIESGEEFPPGEYVTDTGLIVPAISLELRNKLEKCAADKGLGLDRMTDVLARAGVDLSTQLLGGAHRLNPTNTHQLPLAVVLCGLSKSGVYGIATARHLASQGIRTIVYLPDLPNYPANISKELSIYKLSGQKWTFTPKGLPQTPVDLIICALEDHEMWEQEHRQPWLKHAQKWANGSRAPVLTIDPPNGPQEPILKSKIILVPGLPLWHHTDSDSESNYSRVYMANLGIPKKIYSEVGIKYESPFGAKCVIPLHKVS